jgi:serine/threonine protein kinase/class 3 adenylate cyclase
MDTPNEAPPFGLLELQAPMGIGPVSSRYSARDPGDASLVELRALHELTPAHRARLIQLAALRHDGLLPIRSLHLDGPGPHYLTVHGPNAGWAESAPRSNAGLRAALTELSDALAAAHREGLVHGTLEAGHIVRAPRGWWLDLTGTDPSPRPRRAPELANGQAATAAADIWALGTIVIAALASHDDAELGSLLAEMTAVDPESRPTADRVAGRLDRTMAAHVASPSAAPKVIPTELGPYTLLEKLGEGGMGAVYRARGRGEDHDVALKVLLPEWSRDKLVLARFRREARVLSQLCTPHIARFIAARRDAEWEYLVMEFVEGRSAHWLLQKRGPFSVRASLAIGCDIARALAEVHALELVHRDVKPSNILIAADSDPAIEPRSKLCDFGIVRPKVEDDAGALTRTGTPGTPSYMAPEQVLGSEVSAATDTYALGATLFALLTGKPPFVGDSNAVLMAHLSEPPPSLLERVPGIDPGVADLIARALSKDPADRPRDARAMLDELEVLRRGAAIALEALPQAKALEGEPSRFAYAWDLSSTPEELWPHVSNTERLNRAIGLEDVVWAREGVGEASKMTGSFRAAGMTLKWKENPFEWVAPHRLGVVREYESGPFDWMRSTVELTPTQSGTRLSHTIEMKPRGFLGRAAAGIEIGMRMRRALERTYKRIDDACVRSRALEARPEDPFEQPAALSASQRDLLHARLNRARARGGDDHVLDALGDWILTAPPQAIARMRPHAFADQCRLAREATLSAFLLAASEGVLAMLWDILCPTCRIPSQLHETLKALEEHGRCDACDLDFELDLARSVELVFRVEPSVRSADLGTYCIGGPAHSPHVVAQVRLPKGQRFSMPVTLNEGAYQIRGRGLPKSHPFRAIRGAPLRVWSVSLRDGLDPEALRIVGEGAMQIELLNDLERDVVVRLERSTERRDLVTAADATSNPLFRRLFPQQILSPEELIGISQVALLCAEVPDAGGRYQTHDDRLVHADLIELQRQVTEAAEAEGGALVKLQLEGVLAVFADPAAATRASIRLLSAMKGEVRASVHAGTAMLTTINQRLDYFGRTVFTAAELLREARAGEVVVSEETQRADPRAGEALEAVELVAVVQRHAIGMRYRLRSA